MTDKVIGFNEEGYEQYKKIAREVTRRMMNEGPHRARWRNVPKVDQCVILDATLTVATNSKTDASSGLATICVWDVTTNDFTETTTQITVWNHSETTSHSVDTFGVARWIAGHWWFFGDCSAMASR